MFLIIREAIIQILGIGSEMLLMKILEYFRLEIKVSYMIGAHLDALITKANLERN
jgi:hypothetical protein